MSEGLVNDLNEIVESYVRILGDNDGSQSHKDAEGVIEVIREASARIAALEKEVEELKERHMDDTDTAMDRAAAVLTQHFKRGYLAGREAGAKVAALYTQDQDAKSIHPDVPYRQMSETARMVAHMTAQNIAYAIRAIPDETEPPA